MGRRSLITRELVDRIADLVESNPIYPVRAAQACGISHQTHYNWIQRGLSELDEIDPDQHTKADLVRLADELNVEIRKSWTKKQIAEALTGRSLYVEYVERIATAEATLENVLVADAHGMADSTWDVLRILERRFPDRWSKRTTVGVFETEAPPPGTLVDPAHELAESDRRLQLIQGGKAS